MENTTPSSEGKTKNTSSWFRRHPVWSVVLILLAVSIITSALEDKSPKTDVVQTQTKEKPVAETAEKINQPVSSPVAVKSYKQVFSFSGNGAKKSEPFTITGGRFKISYDCNGDLCQAFLYKVGSNFPQVIMNSPGLVKDSTIEYGSGDYYIQANTVGNYSMTVEDYR